MTTKIKTSKALRVDGKFMIELADGRNAFLKTCLSDFTHRDSGYQALDREKVCIEHLQGLAVPEVVKLPKRSLPPPFATNRKAIHLCLLDHGRDFGHIGLSQAQILGACLFVAEQLVAFRRSQILYTDVKCANVVAEVDPLRVRVIDFGCALPVIDGKVTWRYAGYTPGFEPPETTENGIKSERAVVYQWGMMVAHTLSSSKLNNDTLRHPKKGLSLVLARLERLGAGGLCDVLSDALAADARRRPKGFEALLARIRAVELSDKVTRVWQELREPFEPALSDAGLDW